MTIMSMASASLAAAPDAVATPEASVFDAPEMQAKFDLLMQRVLFNAAAGRLDEAENLLRDAADKADTPVATTLYNLACVQSARGNTDAAIESLTAAVAAGFDHVETLEQDPDLAPLRRVPRFEEISRDVERRARAARERRRLEGPLPQPRRVEAGVAEVAEANTVWVPPLSRFVVAHAFPPADPRAEITTQPGAVGDLLRQWRTEGTAAGLHGVLYDNHDDDHSNMDFGWFPELTRVEYADVVKRTRTSLHAVGELHRGLQLLFLHNAPLIGNASVAQIQGASSWSMPRLAMANSNAMRLLADQYANNQIYFYPEHRDHDPEAEGGFGDVYPANVPYVITSQGSSGSDRAFLNAVASTIAAFTPDTQRFLVEKRLLAPTVQMILRRSRAPIVSRADYVSGKAHPPVFDAATLDVERMVRMAHELESDEVPPLVRLKVEDEYLGRPGIDYFEAGPTERMFDTISAVARTARSARFRRRMVVSVADTQDPSGRPLSFVWKLLRGDEGRVSITPLDPQGTRAEIVVDWHPRAVHPGSDLPSSRVDVGVFADNGACLSAPAFLSWYFPANENRTYEDVPATAAPDRKDEMNGNSPKRIVSIERLPAAQKASYVDPLIVTPADWTDTYRYDEEGSLLGWARTRGDAREEFTPDGHLLVKAADPDRAPEAFEVIYRRNALASPPVLTATPNPRPVRPAE